MPEESQPPTPHSSIAKPINTKKVASIAITVTLVLVTFGSIGLYVLNKQTFTTRITTTTKTATTSSALAVSVNLAVSSWKIYHNSNFNYSIEVPSGKLSNDYKVKEYNLPEASQRYIREGVTTVHELEVAKYYYDGINKEPYDWEIGSLLITKEPIETAITRFKNDASTDFNVFLTDELTLAGTKVIKLTEHQVIPTGGRETSYGLSLPTSYLDYHYFAEKKPYTYILGGRVDLPIFRRFFDSFQLN